MLFFPNSKVNLGLYITKKRPDGFHNIETVFYPVNWCDALELIENPGSNNLFEYTSSGIRVEGKIEDNLIYKAWKQIAELKNLPPLKVHLHKHIPMGAGLGGGSSNAATFINLANEKFSLGLTYQQKFSVASSLGSDCAFFLENKPVLATGKGDEFSPINCDLGNYYILLVYPDIHSNTKDAYSGIKPKSPETNLRQVIEKYPVKDWKDLLINDFEAIIFKKYPAIAELKEYMYLSGALYAAMSGSGSTVYGVFEKEPSINFPGTFQYYLQKPLSNIL